MDALIGRARYLDELDRVLVDAAGGRPRIAVVAGEAGVGKTRLLDAARERAVAAGWAVLWGECARLGDGGRQPYGAIVAALRRAVEGGAAGSLPPEAGRELSRLFPQLASATGPPPPEPSAFGQARLFELLFALLANAGGEQPTLVVLEDVHWADPATRDFLAVLARNLQDERLAVVCSFRDDELERTDPTVAVLADLRRHSRTRWLDLEPLERADLELMLTELGGGAPPPEALVDDIHRRSGGNCFLAEELFAAGPARSDALDAVLLSRALTLPVSVRALLDVFAVVGRPIGPDLATALELPPDDVRSAVAAHVLARRGDALAFRHALTGEAIYDELLAAERELVHRRVAGALEATGDGTASELALHLARGGEHAPAAEAFARAGAQAAGVFAFDHALECFEAALSALERAGSTDAPARLSLLLDAADAARFNGEYDRSAELCERALAAGDGEAAGVWERLGRARILDGRFALEAYAKALSLLAPDDEVARARVLGAQAQVQLHLQRSAEARESCALAISLAQRAGAHAEECSARTSLGLAYALLGDLDAARAELRDASELARRHRLAAEDGRIQVYLAEALRMGGAIGEARAVAAAGAETARSQGLQGYVGAFLHTQAAIDAFKLGDWEAAAAAAAALVAQPLALTTRVAIDAVRGRLALEYGQLESARSILQAAWGSSTGASFREYVPAIASGLADLELAGGDAEAAWDRVQAGLVRLGDAADGLAAPELYATGGRVTSALREPGERGVQLLDGLDRLLSEQPYRLPEAAAYRAQLEAELAAEPAWSAVAVRWNALAMPRHEAYARLREAETAMVGRDREAAAAALARAQALVGALGAVGLGAGIDALARSARLTPAPKAKTNAPAAASPFGLSTRELDVLSLLAEGLTNRQIAERLFISSRTAGVHVAHILQKMSVRNRVEAASTAQRLGLTTPQRSER